MLEKVFELRIAMVFLCPPQQFKTTSEVASYLPAVGAAATLTPAKAGLHYANSHSDSLQIVCIQDKDETTCLLCSHIFSPSLRLQF